MLLIITNEDLIIGAISFTCLFYDTLKRLLVSEQK